jgi:hypothetical protein
VLLALLSWPLLLNTNGIYWDDWTLIGQPVNQVATVMLSLGAWFAAAIHATLLSLGNGIVSYRIACFCATIVVAVAIYRILAQSDFVGKIRFFFIAALALVFPVNYARTRTASSARCLPWTTGIHYLSTSSARPKQFQ